MLHVVVDVHREHRAARAHLPPPGGLLHPLLQAPVARVGVSLRRCVSTSLQFMPYR